MGRGDVRQLARVYLSTTGRARAYNEYIQRHTSYVWFTTANDPRRRDIWSWVSMPIVGTALPRRRAIK